MPVQTSTVMCTTFPWPLVRDFIKFMVYTIHSKLEMSALLGSEVKGEEMPLKMATSIKTYQMCPMTHLILMAI